MAKAKSFKVDTKKKAIILYKGIDPDVSEKNVIEFYLGNGYMPKFEEKAKSKTVAEMRKELEAAPEKLEEFNAKYAEKGGFHNACKVYTKWVKDKKAAPEEKTEN